MVDAARQDEAALAMVRKPAPSVTVTQPRPKPWVGRVHIRSCRNPVSKALRKEPQAHQIQSVGHELISAVKTKVQDAPGG
jgi:hypothetical protein